MKPPPSTSVWHARYQQQALWTRGLRDYLFGRIDLSSGSRILEVGCGTGVLTAEMHRRSKAQTTGIDTNRENLRFARDFDRLSRFAQGDGAALPFTNGIFDLVYCHFLLLWVEDPAAVIKEMRRVTRESGVVMAAAEPDYGGRIDYPVELTELGQLQGKALEKQGANPRMGRQLAGLFHEAGLTQVESGVLGGQWSDPAASEAWEMEWQVLEADLGGAISAERLAELRRIDEAAWQHGERILFVPTFYAWGRV